MKINRKKRIQNAKAIMNIHILGNSPDIKKIADFAKEKNVLN